MGATPDIAFTSAVLGTQVVDERIVAIWMHQLTELPARTAEMPSTILGCIEGRRRINVTVGAGLKEVLEWVVIGTDLVRVVRYIPGNVEQRRRTVSLPLPVQQEVRKGQLGVWDLISLAVPFWIEKGIGRRSARSPSST